MRRREKLRRYGKACFCLLSTALFLTGCQGGQREDAETPSSEDAPSSYEAAERLIVTYQTMPTSSIRDLEEVTEEINRISVEEIGVEIEFRVAGASEAFTEYPLWISRGERIDLMMLNYQDITTYVNQKMLYPLDGLLEKEGQELLGFAEEGIRLTEGAVVRGEAYGVSVIPDYAGSGVGLWVAESLAEKAGLDYGEKHVYTLEELGEFFQRCKELYPDSYPLGQITAGNTSSAWTYYGGPRSGLGGDPVSGILTEEGLVADYYESQEYLAYLYWLRDCYKAGYIYPDAAFTDAYQEELIAEGLVLSYPWASSPGYSQEEIFGEKTICLRTSPVVLEAGNSRSGFWTIPVTSGNPEAAMRFLNLMYTDERIANLIQYGIASRHYVVLDVETGRIGYPYGVYRSTTGYYNPLYLYGDRRRMYTFDSPETIERKRTYEQEALRNREEALDFSFDTEPVSGELAAVRKVTEKYVPLLESGSAEVDPLYQEFLLQLKMAGMDEIIREKQRQYDLQREE
ncbi:MAG: ABC transporter substrate-binding protein [Roseburia sp.]|nr:ABC transporter substrate-binding protein [Roseburia sp.]MCM1098474.1 ABC transporter substrate-binding protein [Ruminococcus flavefaciens]